ncbi:uncharacterized protein LOC143289219 [Babylonia areolata]|uniref:uncharacterized protein LOC143289219 n=1 Tax=Babylonia areolata TaxID=304850 RepID=UPI003FD54785
MECPRLPCRLFCLTVVVALTSAGPLLPTSTSPLTRTPDGDGTNTGTPTSGVESGNSSSNSSQHDSPTNLTSTPPPVNSHTTTSSPPRLTRCRYDLTEHVRNENFEVDGENLPMLMKQYLVDKSESRCYFTRRDLESVMDPSATSDAIVAFAVGCLNPQGTDVVFMEDDEAEELDASSRPATSGNSSVPSETGSEEQRTGNMSSPYRWYPHAISYLQTIYCRINLKAVDILANMSELRVLTVIANRAWNLSEVVEKPELCRAFRNVVALGILRDWTTSTYLPHLALCADYLHNLVEMDFTNDSLTSFPQVLHTAIPNLRALEMGDNNLTAPVDFPWPPGFATLPRNMSRTYQFNIHYNFDNSFDMQPNLFRRVYLLNGNRITNLTHFQFHSDFQYISIERNGLKEIAADVFDNVPSLQFLSLAHNDLELLPENVFARLVNLRRLDLQGNKLVSLPTPVFSTVRKLELLDLGHNHLQVIQEGLFTRLQELTRVSLKNNQIVEVRKEAFTTHAVKLKQLELQHNPLRTFPVIVLLLRGLLHTYLDYTNIQVLDFVDISSQTTLSVLADALKNPTTGEFVNVRENPDFQKIISLKNSQLRSVALYNESRETTGIFLLVIQHFTIQLDGSPLACDCHILNVTHTLQEWKENKILTGNEACLEGWQCAWPSELSGKPVAVLRDEETYCPLKEEDGGGQSSCPEGCECYVRTKVHTVIVDCQSGGLTSLPETVPDRTQELWLQNNTIQSLERRPYLTHLTSLKLTSNNVKDLPMDVLLQMPDLKVLHLDDNWLTDLKPDFARLEQLKEVRLAGNPFRCDCTTLWLKGWILEHQRVLEDWPAIKCTTEEDDGHVFTSVPDQQFVCKVPATLSQLALPVAVPVTFAFLLLTLAVLTFLQRRRLKVLLYIHTGYHPFDRDPPDHQALYDVTVVCDVAARAWVLRHVIETLEEEEADGGTRYKVFFYSRDAFLGFTTSENVRHCVRNSKRMVVALGAGWARDELLVTAVHEALAKCLKDMPHFLTVLLHHLLVKDIDDSVSKELHHYVHRGRYISTEDKHFAKRLLYEMPHVKATRKKEKKAHPEKVAAKRPKKYTKDKDPGPIPMCDIVAVAENEENMQVEEVGRNRDSVGEGEGVYVRQVSEHEVDVDLRQSGAEQYNIAIMDRQHHNQQPPAGDNNDDESDEDNNAYAAAEDVADDRHNDGDMNDNEAPHHHHHHHPAGLENQVSVESARSQQPRSIFVWYAQDDLPFVLKNIVEPLERRGHACILEDRDFLPGAAIQENIVQAVESSTRCILVLSDRTGGNDWFHFTFHVAFDRHLQARDHRVALVSREGMEVGRFPDEVQQVIRSSCLLSEGDPWFWKRLNTFVHLDQAEL